MVPGYQIANGRWLAVYGLSLLSPTGDINRHNNIFEEHAIIIMNQQNHSYLLFSTYPMHYTYSITSFVQAQ